MSRPRPRSHGRRGLYAAPAGRLLPALVATGTAAVLGLGVAAVASSSHTGLSVADTSSANVVRDASGATVPAPSVDVPSVDGADTTVGTAGTATFGNHVGALVAPPRKPKPWLWTYDVLVTTHFRDDKAGHRAFPSFDVRPVSATSLPPGVEQRTEALLADVTQELVSQFDSQASSLSGTGYRLELDAQVPLRDGPLLAVRLDDSSDFQGAHPLVFSRSVVVDLRTGRAVSLSSLLAPGGTAGLDRVARAAYLHTAGDYLFPDVVASWSALRATWWPQSDGLHLVADQCDLAACAAGEPEVVLPWPQVKPLLSPAGAALLPW
ncbi:MAG: hypothetical protein ACTHMW_01480 [Actinomycetes bacterium]